MEQMVDYPNSTTKDDDGQWADGVHYEPAIGEWVCVLAGYVFAYADDRCQAMRRYAEELRTRREHRQRNPANGHIPFEGEPGTGRDTGTPADYGLVEW